MTGAYEFVRLADVETAQEVQDTDTVLIIQGNTVKKTAKSNVGGGSAAVYFVTSDGHFRTGTDWGTGVDVTVADIVSAYNDGPVKVYEMYGGSFVGVGEVVGYKMYNGSERLIYMNPNTRELVYLA